jgi:hypothetical protein
MDKELKPSDLSYQFPFIIFYKGNHEHIPTIGIIDMVKQNLDLIREKNSVRPLLDLLIETLRNIERYSTHKNGAEDCALIYMDEHNFYCNAQNLIDNSKVTDLREILSSLEGKSREELDKAYENAIISETGKSAGLGFIDLARKTHNRMIYDFRPFSAEVSLYTISYAVPIKGADISHFPDFTKSHVIFRMLKTSYRQSKSALLYNGDFSNRFVHALLDFLNMSKEESQGKTSKLHYILIELAQNVRRHSYGPNGVSQGQLCLEWAEKAISVYTFNTANEENTTTLRQKIEKLNASSPDELKEYHQATLKDFSTDGGVGLIDIAILLRGEKISIETRKKKEGLEELKLQLTYKNE